MDASRAVSAALSVAPTVKKRRASQLDTARGAVQPAEKRRRGAGAGARPRPQHTGRSHFELRAAPDVLRDAASGSSCNIGKDGPNLATAHGPTSEDVSCSDALAAALEETARFDQAIGLKENVKKRQIWAGAQKVEHLGLRIQGGVHRQQRNHGSDGIASGRGGSRQAARPTRGTKRKALAEVSAKTPAMPEPQDGWEPTRLVIKRLAILPGPAEGRERLAVMFVLPRIRWAAPLVEPPPRDFPRRLRQATLASACTWWCQGRWWADRIQTHPIFGAAMQALKAAGRVADKPSWVLDVTLREHAKNLKLLIVCYNGDHGV